jgi:hypothetical protein
MLNAIKPSMKKSLKLLPEAGKERRLLSIRELDAEILKTKG